MMRNFVTALYVAVLVATVAFAVPAQACTRATCSGGPAGCDDQLLYDTDFSDGCNWVYQGDSARVYYFSNWWAEMQTIAKVYQDVAVPSNAAALRLSFNVVISGHPDVGTEVIHLDIVRPSDGVVLEHVYTLDVLGEYGGTYHVDLDSSYAGQTIRVQFRTYEGNYPGADTEFHIDWVKLWMFN
jgi:hypothetical protein